MNVSAPFISRPVGTTLLTLALALVGVVAYALLPVSPLPQIDFPTISVTARLPGASPETMASTVATPLERSLGRIAGISEMTSESSLGTTRIVLQFDLTRDIDGAARDVQAAINAARATLPTLPSNPTYRKMNPADMPIMSLGLTSDVLPIGELYDAASTILSEKLSQVYGVGQVNVGGGAMPAVRVEVQPGLLNSQGLSLEEVGAALARANANLPKGMLDNGEQQWFVGANDQLRTAEEFAPLIVRYQDQATLRLADVAAVRPGVQDERNAGYANGKRAILLMIYREPGANIIDTVRRVRETLPLLRAWTPEEARLDVLMDRSPSIRNSVREVEFTLLVSMALVVLVVFLFLRNGRATFIPAVAVPVSLLGTFGIMYLAGFSLNHLSLMALTIATGFVVDDAIVVTENIVRHMENGEPPRRAAYLGSREVAFTVMSISLSLVAIFIPILGMGGLVGRLFKEFAVTLSTAVLVSLAVSLVVTPMMCAHLLRPGMLPPHGSPRVSGAGLYAWLLSLWGNGMALLQRGYAATLAVVLRHKGVTLLTLLLTICLNVYLYVVVPKGFFPTQDTGQAFGFIQADQSISFQAMRLKMFQLMEIVRAHPDVESVSGFTGGGRRNSGFVFINLKPSAQRRTKVMGVLSDLRKKLDVIPGATLRLQPMQDLSVGGRRTRSMYQYTLQSDDLGLLRDWAPRAVEAFRTIPGMLDVDTDQENRGLQTMVTVERQRMARYGVTQKSVDTALGLAFGQSFASTIYNDATQYRVVLEFAPEYLQGPEGLLHLYVPAETGMPAADIGTGTGLSGNLSSSRNAEAGAGHLVPLEAFSSNGPELTALSVAHQGQFTAATISFNLAPGHTLDSMEKAIRDTLFDIGMPADVRGSFQGTAKLFASGMSSQPWLILSALITLYIVLGILYESLIHPLTILSTLPSAGVGAILGLMAFGAEFSVIAFIGVLLLCGIVKKNAIMMIDFALEARRREGLCARDAIYKACLLRFRPIMMTTMAAMFGALPLLFGSGDGAELRTPLGITIVGGLLVSQVLTLYTTPVVYLYLDRFSRRPADPSRLALLLGEDEPDAPSGRDAPGLCSKDARHE